MGVHDVERISTLLKGRRVAVLSGAGCSTESGIPDYRGPESAKRARKPIQYQEFLRSEAARVRYWARSTAGWQRIAMARPNAGHVALAALEQHDVVHGIITQNVDGLHHAAGSKRVVELHGSLASVRCLSCNARVARSEFQQRLLLLNSEWAERLRMSEPEMAPDGDAELDAEIVRDFHVPQCACGGVMKPDVVFFGENVARDVVDQAWQLFDQCDVLLVVGSSLTVYYGRRFVYCAQQVEMPVAVINIGPTRADDVAAVKVEASTAELLPRLVDMLL